MSSYEELNQNELVPVWLREVITLGLTISAVLLYGGVLFAAIFRTLTTDPPYITYGMQRAASLLSGLVGTVVTAGFARGSREATVQSRSLRQMDDPAPSRWQRFNARSLVKGKLKGLARTVGLPMVTVDPTAFAADDVPVDQPSEPPANRLAMWMAIAYFVIYFFVGLAAFCLTIMRDGMPEMIANAGWVWVGTLVSAGYAFFSMDGS